MKTSVLRFFGAAALIATMSACSGSTDSPAATPSPEATAVAEATTPPPTPTPTASRKYTQDELKAMLGQLKDAQGKALTAVPDVDLAATLEQTKAAFAAMTVEPSECRELAVAGMAPSVEGAAVALASSVDAASGASTAVSMTSGLDGAFLAQVSQTEAQLAKCPTMSVTAGALQLSTSVTILKGVSTLPVSVAYRTNTKISDGRQQSMITSQAVQHGVLITVIRSGGASEQEATARVGALIDSAAALIK